jgi:hypothetical protein
VVSWPNPSGIPPVPVEVFSAGSGLLDFGLGPGARFDMPAIAALTTCTKGGLMPHAKHGGNGVCALAVAGSKFSGTGLEKEQMGHIHVALRAV